MGFAVPKMDDASPVNVSTVLNDTDITEALTSTTMVTVTTTGTTPTPTQVETSGTITSTGADCSRHTESTEGSRIMSRLECL